MRTLTLLALLALVAFPAAAQQPATVDQAVDRIIQREAQVVETLRNYSPLVETYIQELEPDKELGMVPKRDLYFLGKADLQQGIVLNSLTEERKGGWGRRVTNPFRAVGGALSMSLEFNPGGFLNKIFVDPRGIGREQYEYHYIRREFLGEVRCLVFDVVPLREADGRFKGRIWVEDQDFTIVRFNGVRVPERTKGGFRFHFDSWRVHTGPNMWVPAYIYTAEADLKDHLWSRVRFKAQTRLWGYDLANLGRAEEFSSIRVEAPTPVVDQSETSPDRSPIEAQRLWHRQAEENVIERMERAGLLALPGDVDRVLETVVNNLEVTNNIEIEPPIRCRVLLTSRLESFSIGHTIVVSRGLLDVLPDEATLAAVLAHEMANVMGGNPLDANRWGFSNQLIFPDEEAMQRLRFHSSVEPQQVAERAAELLSNSPYKDRLGSAGLFLRQLEQRQRQLPELISPKLGNAVIINQTLTAQAPELAPDQLDQIAALPLGARIKVDPWTNRVEMMKSRPVRMFSARDKLPFEVTPFMPYLVRHTPASAQPAGAVAAQSQSQPQEPEPQPQPEQD
jgi:hypothetical protein